MNSPGNWDATRMAGRGAGSGRYNERSGVNDPYREWMPPAARMGSQMTITPLELGELAIVLSALLAAQKPKPRQ